MYCNKCGNKLEDDMKFCNKCGNKIKNTVDIKKFSKYKKFFYIFIIIVIALILYVAFFNNRFQLKQINSNNQKIDEEQSRIEKYIQSINDRNNNNYDDYMVALKKAESVQYLSVNSVISPTNNQIDIKVEFVENYNNIEIYKFNSKTRISRTSYPSFKYSTTLYGKEVVNYIGKLEGNNEMEFEANTNYYYAKRQSDSKYLFIKGKGSIYSTDIDTLKSKIDTSNENDYINESN